MCHAALEHVNGCLVVYVLLIPWLCGVFSFMCMCLCVYVWCLSIQKMTMKNKNKCSELVTKVENREDDM